MPFGAGWSPSDLVLLIQGIYRVYDTIKNVPDEYKDLLEKFVDIERELTVLESRLAEVGKDKYGVFPGATELRKDLEDANKHLEQFGALDRKGLVKKIVNTAKFTFDSRRTLRYSHRMDIHRARIHDFRQDIILQATLSQLKPFRAATDVQALPADVAEVLSTDAASCKEAGLLSSDHASIFTQAQRSVNLAKKLNRAAPGRSKKRLETIPSESPIIKDLKSEQVDNAIHEFVNDVVKQAEASKLYLRSTVPEAHIKEYTAIAEWLDKIQKVVGESPTITPARKEPNTAAFDPPTVQDLRLSTDLATADPNLSTWWASLAFLDSDDLRSLVKESGTLVPAMGSSSPSNVVDDDNDEASSATTHMTSLLDIASPARETLPLQSAAFICNPSTGRKGMKCVLEISKSEGSNCIWATIPGKMVAMPRTNDTTPFLTPRAHLELPPAGSIENPTWRPMVLRHSVEPGLNSFPAVLHPTVETTNPNNSLAPYEIDFYEAQFLDVEGRGGTAGRIRGYKYMFVNREDRDMMREQLFGRTLLATAGYEESSASTCRIQLLTLWKSHDSSDAAITVTLPSRSHKSMPADRMLEFRVFGYEKSFKATKEKQDLLLYVQSIQNPFDGGLSTRRDSVISTSTKTSNSGNTFMSRISTRSRSARSSSTQNEVLRIKLSDTTPQEKKDKKAFLAKLSELFEPG